MRPERRYTGARGKPTTPLILAVENGHFELAAALLDAGADPNDKPAGYTALHAMSWVRQPIRGDGDPSPAGSYGLNPFLVGGTGIGRPADAAAARAGRGPQTAEQ
jgi:hypothetical protein